MQQETMIGVLLTLASTTAIAQPAPQQQVQQVVRVAQPPAPTRTGDRADLPMQLVDGLPTILATVNGMPFRFGIDTGAGNYLRLTPAVAQKLGLSPIGEARAADPSGKSPVTVQLFEVGSFAFGGLTFSKVVTSSLGINRPGIDGIIGIGFFKDLLLTLDYGKLRFSAAPGSLPAANGHDIVDITLDRGQLPTIPVKVGTWTGDAHLDSGNTRYPFFVPSSAVASMPTKGDARAIGVAHTVNQEISLQAIDLAAPVKVGETDLGITSVGFPSAGPLSNIGSLALRKMAVTIDVASRRARIAPSG